MRSCSLLVVLLVPQLSAAAANRVPVSKLLDQMIRRSTLAEPGGTPFYLKATITDKDDAKSEFKGTLGEYWLSPTKWRRVVKLRDFSPHDLGIIADYCSAAIFAPLGLISS
jgi:hypothetical protein